MVASMIDEVGEGIARPHGRARIETPVRQRSGSRCGGIARPHGRARIETSSQLMVSPRALRASPGLTAGRGLKLGEVGGIFQGPVASPGLTAGRGLKLQHLAPGVLARARIARPHGRARIETSVNRCIPPRSFWHRPASRPGAD